MLTLDVINRKQLPVLSPQFYNFVIHDKTRDNWVLNTAKLDSK